MLHRASYLDFLEQNKQRKMDILLDWMLREIGREDVDWIHVAQDRDQWRAVVYTVMKLRALWRLGFSCLTDD
jgi:hypothetical protein